MQSPTAPLKTLYFFAAGYAALGLLAGLFYREFTKAMDFTGFTQLRGVHTHLFALGAFALLIFLALEKLFGLSALPKRFLAFVITYNAGVLLTATMMVVKGVLQVTQHPMADSAMIAGFAGLGHMTITAAFILLMLILGNRVGFIPSRPAPADIAA